MVWVRTAVLEIPRQSVELKAREANLSSLPSLFLLEEVKSEVGDRG